MSAAKLTLKSAATLSSGQIIPLLGFGVYLNRGNSCYTAVKAALEAGYRHIDSAIVYRNETEVGQAVRDSNIPRQELFITSKATSRYAGYDVTSKSIDESLARFGFDYLDLFLIHDPYAGREKRLESWKALIHKRDEGKLRTIGVSNYGVHHLEEIKEAGLEQPAVNQIELHPWCQQRGIVDYCTKNGILLEAYSPLTRGRYLDNEVLVKIAEKHKKEPAQVLVRWALQMNYVPLPKSSQPARIVSNSQVFDFELSKDEMDALYVLDKGAEGATTWHPVNAP